jgi:hypothetical protein
VVAGSMFGVGSRCRPACTGLIAPRLDTLTAERKHLLHDAAVVGTVFWSGALADMGHLGPGRCGPGCTTWPAPN